MKILALDLTAFGPFTDLRLDLSGGSEGLHLIHGPNEAGKSSTLRALSDFLFGIPERSTDNFLHKHSAMRIGATLRDARGETTTLIRRKGRRPTLRTPEDDPRDDGALANFVGGLTRDDFERHHRIDHDQLVSGGRAMIEGEGDFGRMLFAAGSGAAGFRNILAAYEDEAKKLFAPRAQVAVVNAALSDLKAKRQERIRLSLPTRTWVEADERKRGLETSLARLDGELRRLAAEKRRLERIGQRLPVAAGLREAERKLGTLSNVRPLSDDFAERRARAKHARPDAIRRRDEARLEIGRIDEELARLGEADPLLGAADEIRRLVEDKAGYLKARETLPRRRREIELLEDRARRLALELGPEFASPAEDLRPISPRVRKAIEKLRDEHIRLAAQHEEATAEAASLDDGTAPTVEPDEEAVEALRLGLKRWQSHGRLDETVVKLRTAFEAATEAAESALRRLPLWSGTLDGIVSALLPAVETVERHEDERAKRERAANDLTSRIEEIDEEIDRLDEEAARDQLDGGAPSEADLEQAREARDALWVEIRDAVSRTGPGPVARYEAACRECDVLADRLRREADRVAKRTAREADRATRRTKRAKLVGKLEDNRRAAAEAIETWRSLWSPHGIEPATPKEMLGWLKKREELIRLGRAARDARTELEIGERTRRDLLAEIRSRLADVGPEPPATDDSLGAALDRAQAALDRVDRRGRLTDARQRAELARVELESWRERWTAAVAVIGPDVDPDSVADHFARRDELLRTREELAAKRIEAAGHETAVAAFEERVKELAERHAPDRLDLAADRIAADLAGRFQEAEKIARRRQTCMETREGAVRREAEARIEIASAEGILESLAAEAGTEDLARAEADWNEAKEIRARVATMEENLLALGEGMPLDAILAELDATTAEEIAERLERVEAEMRPLEAERDEANRELGGLAKELEQWDGGSRAAEAEEEAQAILAKLSNDAESYVRLKLGAALLRKAMDRYREKNAGPILVHAGRIFSELTLGSFSDLHIEEEGDDHWLLRCVRSDGREVKIEGLSEGTADALYLSLRLAALRAESERREPVPFVVDDILVNLDERRAAAAIGALADLARRTQVLLFTHHAHVVDLARSRLVEGSELFVHTLPDPLATVGRG